MTIKPALEDVKEEFEGKIDWISVNTKEDRKGLSTRFQVSVVPTFIAFKGEFSERKRQAVEAVYEAR
jgi:thioredoxin-like negative regulator of GroEL